MGNEIEKLKIISGMIQSSMVNSALAQTEYEFICSIGTHLGLNQDVIDEYIKEKEIFIIPNNLTSKVIRFYKMALRNKKQRKSYFKWIRASYKQGLHMGLPQDTIRDFLYDLHFCNDYSEGERIIKKYLVK